MSHPATAGMAPSAAVAASMAPPPPSSSSSPSSLSAAAAAAPTAASTAMTTTAASAAPPSSTAPQVYPVMNTFQPHGGFPGYGVPYPGMMHGMMHGMVPGMMPGMGMPNMMPMGAMQEMHGMPYAMHHPGMAGVSGAASAAGANAHAHAHAHANGHPASAGGAPPGPAAPYGSVSAAGMDPGQGTVTASAMGSSSTSASGPTDPRAQAIRGGAATAATAAPASSADAKTAAPAAGGPGGAPPPGMMPVPPGWAGMPFGYPWGAPGQPGQGAPGQGPPNPEMYARQMQMLHQQAQMHFGQAYPNPYMNMGMNAPGGGGPGGPGGGGGGGGSDGGPGVHHPPPPNAPYPAPHGMPMAMGMGMPMGMGMGMDPRAGGPGGPPTPMRGAHARDRMNEWGHDGPHHEHGQGPHGPHGERERDRERERPERGARGDRGHDGDRGGGGGGKEASRRGGKDGSPAGGDRASRKHGGKDDHGHGKGGDASPMNAEEVTPMGHIRSIWIGDLPTTVSPQDLVQYFRPYGNVVDTRLLAVIRNSRGAFVSFEHPWEAYAALNGKTVVEGRALIVRPNVKSKFNGLPDAAEIALGARLIAERESRNLAAHLQNAHALNIESNCLQIHLLPLSLTEQAVRHVVAPYGTLEHIEFVDDQFKNPLKTAKVTFRRLAEARAAQLALQGTRQFGLSYPIFMLYAPAKRLGGAGGSAPSTENEDRMVLQLTQLPERLSGREIREHAFEMARAYGRVQQVTAHRLNKPGLTFCLVWLETSEPIDAIARQLNASLTNPDDDRHVAGFDAVCTAVSFRSVLASDLADELQRTQDRVPPGLRRNQLIAAMYAQLPAVYKETDPNRVAQIKCSRKFAPADKGVTASLVLLLEHCPKSVTDETLQAQLLAPCGLTATVTDVQPASDGTKAAYLTFPSTAATSAAQQAIAKRLPQLGEPYAAVTVRLGAFQTNVVQIADLVPPVPPEERLRQVGRAAANLTDVYHVRAMRSAFLVFETVFAATRALPELQHVPGGYETHTRVPSDTSPAIAMFDPDIAGLEEGALSDEEGADDGEEADDGEGGTVAGTDAMPVFGVHDAAAAAAADQEAAAADGDPDGADGATKPSAGTGSLLSLDSASSLSLTGTPMDVVAAPAKPPAPTAVPSIMDTVMAFRGLKRPLETAPDAAAAAAAAGPAASGTLSVTSTSPGAGPSAGPTDTPAATSPHTVDAPSPAAKRLREAAPDAPVVTRIALKSKSALVHVSEMVGSRAALADLLTDPAGLVIRGRADLSTDLMDQLAEKHLMAGIMRVDLAVAQQNGQPPDRAQAAFDYLIDYFVQKNGGGQVTVVDPNGGVDAFPHLVHLIPPTDMTRSLLRKLGMAQPSERSWLLVCVTKYI
ncbi:hypothetical protein CXG81DRAFT_27809 [Caulochytrium protostelioides]|uniref:RRM domain-containing protein n=1 Tax=Caulochytrium protostelioides TaxID=1555241 RepID=A0A4V1IU61_9FUNG|nr:hypothetical protein CXG81DRAFT_27809 [Caulochytrium protostelioides]|eukprot:RKO99438.1 hypothetical protein CXG81DRAFT_27809 [Caulochytrium protostelioides]